MEKRLLTCRELIDFLAAYLDGELAAETRADFERHLSLCPACVDYLAGYREAIRLGKRACEPDAVLPEDVPAELVDAVLAARRS
jgi:anti-sigma factor (TIGR02949 family)